MTKKCTNVNQYERVPRFFWIVYEIVREDNYLLSIEEMQELLQGTNIETVSTIDIIHSNDIVRSNESNLSSNLSNIVNDITDRIENGKIASCLGGKLEGIVAKCCTLVDDKYKITRYKYVRSEFSEIHRDKSKRLEQKCKEMTDDEFIESIGNSFLFFVYYYSH